MKYIFNYRRKAIAMIELIFALVVMGIVMLSIPNLLGMAASSSYTSLQQEAIATAASDISIILGREWDEMNTFQEIGEPILVTAGADDLFSRSDKFSRTFKLKTGGGSLFATYPLGSEDGDSDDIDDANAVTVTLTDNQAVSSKTGSIDQDIIITTLVNYINDEEGAKNWKTQQSAVFNYNNADMSKTTNIKNITTRLTTNTGAAELNKDITLFAFSCNIGGFKRERKVFQ